MSRKLFLCPAKYLKFRLRMRLVVFLATCSALSFITFEVRRGALSYHPLDLSSPQSQPDLPALPARQPKPATPMPVKRKVDKVTHVRFLKVHKAGSTTIQNMLFRFALRHDLNVLLPTEGHYIYENDAQIPIPAGEHFDIFACHTAYKKPWFDSILPRDAVNIGIIRKPAERFVSAAFYYRDIFHEAHLMEVPKDNFISDLVQNSEQYEKSFFSRTKNAMGKDFGFPPHISRNDTQIINSHLSNLNKEFSLVLVMERFAESLVLMRRLLRWSLLDVIYIRVNSHNYEHVTLEPGEVSKLNQTSFLDFVVYDYFYDKFEEKLKRAGPDFHEEVIHLKQTLEIVETFCKAHLGEAFHIEASKWNEPLTMPYEECNRMRTGETHLISKLKLGHFKKYPSLTNVNDTSS